MQPEGDGEELGHLETKVNGELHVFFRVIWLIFFADTVLNTIQPMSHILFLRNFTELRVRNVLINVNARHEHKDLDTFKERN